MWLAGRFSATLVRVWHLRFKRDEISQVVPATGLDSETQVERRWFLKGTCKARTSNRIFSQFFVFRLCACLKSPRAGISASFRSRRKTILLRAAKGAFALAVRRPKPTSRCGNLVEILWDARVDAIGAARYGCNGFEDSRIRTLWVRPHKRVRTDRIRAAPADGVSVFDNTVERASRERTDSGISPERSHKIGHCVLSGMQVVANTLFRAWSWQPTFYPSVGN